MPVRHRWVGYFETRFLFLFMYFFEKRKRSGFSSRHSLIIFAIPPQNRDAFVFKAGPLASESQMQQHGSSSASANKPTTIAFFPSLDILGNQVCVCFPFEST